MERDFICLMVSFAMPAAVELSVWTGFAGWGRPTSESVCRCTTASFKLLKSAPSSASEADEAT